MRGSNNEEDISANCKLGCEKDQAIAHVVLSVCKQVAQNKYKNIRYDNEVAKIRSHLYEKHGVSCIDKEYNHLSDKIWCRSGEIWHKKKKLLDLNLQTEEKVKRDKSTGFLQGFWI